MDLLFELGLVAMHLAPLLLLASRRRRGAAPSPQQRPAPGSQKDDGGDEDDDDDGEPLQSGTSQLFNEAVRYLSNPATSVELRPSQEDRLRLYALFKVATVGPCQDPKPSVFDIVGRAKW